MDDIKSLQAFLSAHAEIASEHQFRWWIFNRELNGIEASGAVVKKAGRWYVNVPKLREWILSGDKAAA